MEGKDIIAFVKNGEKFVDCSAFTEVTSQVSCKVGNMKDKEKKVKLKF